MRVPELNWPSNLFTDIIIVPKDMIVVSAPAFAAKPDLWREMRAAWIGGDAGMVVRLPVPFSGAAHGVA